MVHEILESVRGVHNGVIQSGSIRQGSIVKGC